MRAIGPYAFMDIFDPMHVCNHTDQEGRYAYKVTFLQCYSVTCINTVLVSATARNDVGAFPTPLFCTLIVRVACIH